MSDNDWLKSSLDKIDSKLDRIDMRVDNLDVTSVKQQAILEEHQKRSLANEAAVEVLKVELVPIKEHVIKVKFIVKVISWVIASAAGIEYLIHKFFSGL